MVKNWINHMSAHKWAYLLLAVLAAVSVRNFRSAYKLTRLDKMV
jgi:hypothetical protein